MKKQTLQEQVSRIKSMMSLNEQHSEMETPQEDVPQVGDNELSQKAQDAVQQLSPEEQEILTNFIQNNPQGFVHTVKKEVSQEKQEEMTSEMSEEDEMSDSEFEARRILHKIIQYVGVGSMIAVVPAAMFIGGGVAAALGVTALAGTMFKDAAFFKKGGNYRDHHYDAQDKAERMNEEQTPSNLVACSGLGVKSPGLCDKSSKRPVVECAKLGVKSIGYCFVDTKQPVTTTTTK